MKKLKSLQRFLVAICLCFALVISCACGNNSTTSGTVNLDLFETTELDATGLTGSITWTTSDETVVTVKDGVASAVAEGNARITAKTDKKTVVYPVTVEDSGARPAVSKIDDVTLYETKTVNLGEIVKTTYKNTPITEGVTYAYTVASDKVTENGGVLTGVAAGIDQVSVKATYKGFTTSQKICNVTVLSANLITPEKATVSLSTVEKDVDPTSYEIKAQVVANAEVVKDPKITAQVLEGADFVELNGLTVTAKKIGEAKIGLSCEANGKTVTGEVKVTVHDDTVSYNPNYFTLGQTVGVGDDAIVGNPTFQKVEAGDDAGAWEYIPETREGTNYWTNVIIDTANVSSIPQKNYKTFTYDVKFDAPESDYVEPDTFPNGKPMVSTWLSIDKGQAIRTQEYRTEEFKDHILYKSVTYQSLSDHYNGRLCFQAINETNGTANGKKQFYFKDGYKSVSFKIYFDNTTTLYACQLGTDVTGEGNALNMSYFKAYDAEGNRVTAFETHQWYDCVMEVSAPVDTTWALVYIGLENGEKAYIKDLAYNGRADDFNAILYTYIPSELSGSHVSYKVIGSVTDDMELLVMYDENGNNVKASGAPLEYNKWYTVVYDLTTYEGAWSMFGFSMDHCEKAYLKNFAFRTTADLLPDGGYAANHGDNEKPDPDVTDEKDDFIKNISLGSGGAKVEKVVSGEFANSYKYTSKTAAYAGRLTFNDMVDGNDGQAKQFFTEGKHYVSMEIYVKSGSGVTACNWISYGEGEDKVDFKYEGVLSASNTPETFYVFSESGRQSYLGTGAWYQLFIEVEYDSVPDWALVYLGMTGSKWNPAVAYIRNVSYSAETPELVEKAKDPSSTVTEFHYSEAAVEMEYVTEGDFADSIKYTSYAGISASGIRFTKVDNAQNEPGEYFSEGNKYISFKINCQNDTAVKAYINLNWTGGATADQYYLTTHPEITVYDAEGNVVTESLKAGEWYTVVMHVELDAEVTTSYVYLAVAGSEENPSVTYIKDLAFSAEKPVV